MDELDQVVHLLRELNQEPVMASTLLIWGRCRERGIDLSADLLNAARQRLNEPGPAAAAPPTIPCG